MSDSTGLTAEEVADLMPGDNVLVHGLVSRPALNGRLGMVTGTFEAASGRLPVQVEHEPGPIALKPSNLEPSALPEGCRYFIGPAQPAEKSQPKPAKERSPKPKPKGEAARIHHEKFSEDQGSSLTEELKNAEDRAIHSGSSWPA